MGRVHGLSQKRNIDAAIGKTDGGREPNPNAAAENAKAHAS
jgi:hypothetical protein